MSTLCQRQVGRLGPFYNIRIYRITINLQDSAISMTAIVIKSAYFGDLAEANVSSWFQRKSLTLFHTTGHTVNVPVYYVWVIDWVKLRYCRTVHEASEVGRVCIEKMMNQASAERILLMETAGGTSGLRGMLRVKGLNWVRSRRWGLGQIKQNAGNPGCLNTHPMTDDRLLWDHTWIISSSLCGFRWGNCTFLWSSVSDKFLGLVMIGF